MLEKKADVVNMLLPKSRLELDDSSMQKSCLQTQPFFL